MSTTTGTNVVPLNHPQAAAGPAPASGTPGQQMYPPWAMNPIYPMPPGPWSGAPGCAPPGCAPSSLMQCYCDIQNATQFISAIMIDLINNNPAVAQAMIDAIAKSGSNLPLLGVTNGQAAQPGQVGEFVRFQQVVSILGTAQTQSVTMGVLQPGDWDCWLFAAPIGWTADIQLYLEPLPAGFSDNGYAILGDMGPVPIAAVAMTVRGLISVPTLIVATLTTNNSGPGSGASTCTVLFNARRRR